MSIEDTQQYISFDWIDTNESVSRQELQIKLCLKELSNVRLRRRLTRLEKMHGLDADGGNDWIAEQEEKLRQQLDEITEGNDE